MIKSSSSGSSSCGSNPPSNCVIWNGGDIECLGITNGDTLSVTIATLAEEICDLKDQLDLSDLDLKCVFELCITCRQPVKTLQTVLELIINKICSLEEIINSLELSGSTGDDPILNMANCFHYTDADGDLITELPHTSYTKRIAIKVCQILLDISSMQDDISDLQDTVDDLQTQINNLDLELDDVTSDCLFTGSKSIEDAWDILDQAFCQFRTAIGLPTDINIAISRQCEDLNAELGSEPGWQTSPANLAQSVSNIWIALCDIRDRLAANEECCAATCADVEIGFTITLNEARDEATIRFTSGAGTAIPTGFEDEGSTMTVTDESGNSLDFNVTVENNGEEILTLTGLDAGDVYTFDLNAVVGNGSLTCQKCVSKKSIVSTLCNYCEISVTGSGSDSVTVIYDDPNSSESVTNPTITTTTTTTSSTTTTTTTAAP